MKSETIGRIVGSLVGAALMMACLAEFQAWTRPMTTLHASTTYTVQAKAD